MKAGLPVLFERLYPTSKVTTDRASKEIKLFNQKLETEFVQNTIYMKDTDVTISKDGMTYSMELPISQVVPKAHSISLQLTGEILNQCIEVDFNDIGEDLIEMRHIRDGKELIIELL